MSAGVAGAFRRAHGRCVASLMCFLGDLDVFGEAVHEAFAVAAAKWPADGEPPNPGVWITTTARSRAVDWLRRESTRQIRHAQAYELFGPAGDVPALPDEEPVADDRLRLIFTCCPRALDCYPSRHRRP